MRRLVNGGSFGVRHVVVILALIVFAGSACVQAGVLIPLSTHSSEGAIDSGLLSADWLLTSVVLDQEDEGNDAKEWLLSYSLTNLTADPTAFSVDQIYFNMDVDPAFITEVEVKAFDLGDKSNWILEYDSDNIQVAEFGQFDLGLRSTAEVIGPGQTGTFQLKIETTFAATLTEDDFYALSVPPGGSASDEQMPAYGAAKFKRGPNDDSSYGAYVPEPATLCLLGLGALVLRRKRA